ncbi:MAG: acetyl-CoA C-acyltransferase [Betaproteobacteria bacterium]|nr:acetyl-CoA C-acyltransferase [Betaproteobacteria bacterium]
MNTNADPVYVAAGLRTPFARVDGDLHQLDAIAVSVPVVQAMAKLLTPGAHPDFVVWGTVMPSLGMSNIAREAVLDSGLHPATPAFSTVLACSTSMAATFEAASMLGSGGRELAIAGGSESMSRVQFGLNQNFSDWMRRLIQARSFGQRVDRFAQIKFRDVRLFIPTVTNRTTGKSMGEHCEEMVREWHIARETQDRLALTSHERAVRAMANGFFDDLIAPVGEVTRDSLPRANTSLERLAKLSPAFDRSGKGTITAGNASPLTDGAAGVWVANAGGLKRLPSHLPHVQLVDWELAAVNLKTEGLLMAPAYAIPRLLARHNLAFNDIDLWEIHEAFAAQVLCNVAAIENRDFLENKVGVHAEFGAFPWTRVNPNGGSIALGHPFGATGARILSMAIKELAAMGAGKRAIVSICADGGLGTVALLRAV